MKTKGTLEHDAKMRGEITPLHLAASTARDDKTIAQLLSKEAVTAVDCCGRTPLHYAAAANRLIHYRIYCFYFKLFLQFRQQGVISLVSFPGCNAISIDFEGKTPLHLAAMKGATLAATTLLDKYFFLSFLHFHLIFHSPVVNPNAKDSKGFTPLHYAVLNGRRAVSFLLIRAGSDITIAPEGTVYILLVSCFFQFFFLEPHSYFDGMRFISSRNCQRNAESNY